MNFMNEVAHQASNSNSGEPLAIFLILGFYLLVTSVVLWVWARIITKSGHSWVWVFIMLLPVVNAVMVIVFAFTEWPIHRELALTRQALHEATGSPVPYGGQPGQFAQPGQPMSSGTQQSPYGATPPHAPYGASPQPQPYSNGPQPGPYSRPPGTGPYGN